MLSLSELKKQLQSKAQISLQELSITLQEDHDTVRYLLRHFIERGQVVECPYQSACGKRCQQCTQVSSSLYYSWKS